VQEGFFATFLWRHSTASVTPVPPPHRINRQHSSPRIPAESRRPAPAVHSRDPVAQLIENTEYYKTYKLNYGAGEKYPHLVRDESKPDLLTEILKAK
jgi:hypothetical protein